MVVYRRDENTLSSSTRTDVGTPSSPDSPLKPDATPLSGWENEVFREQYMQTHPPIDYQYSYHFLNDITKFKDETRYSPKNLREFDLHDTETPTHYKEALSILLPILEKPVHTTTENWNNLSTVFQNILSQLPKDKSLEKTEYYILQREFGSPLSEIPRKRTNKNQFYITENGQKFATDLEKETRKRAVKIYTEAIEYAEQNVQEVEQWEKGNGTPVQNAFAQLISRKLLRYAPLPVIKSMLMSFKEE